jgi:geranylgeranyl pyrophosphate synthase
MGTPQSETEEIALQWLAKSGKRWRPFLAACVFQSLRDDASAPLPKNICKMLIAIECFHKASLIHDDIEDDDTMRYGEKTVHAQYGVPVALNVGDILVGDGYRLIGEMDLPDDRKVKMLQIAALGHRTLCMGQGAELCWQRHRSPLSTDEILDIYKQKTAPAFEVSLRLGAMYAGADDKLGDMLQRYSTALGIAYQIRDDLSDSGLESGHRLENHNSMDLSLLMAMAYKQAGEADRQRLKSFWQKTTCEKDTADRVFRIMQDLNVVNDIQNLFQFYKNQALSALSPIDNANLKCVLHRVVGKIFCDIAKMGCCNDYQAGNASDRQTRR